MPPRSLSERIRVLADLVARLERDGQVSPADVSGACTEADTLAVLVALGLVANSPGSSEGSPRPQAPRQGPARAATCTDPTLAVAGLDGAALRRLRYRWVHRLGRFADVPADVTWEAATAPGSQWAELVTGRDARRRIGTPSSVPVEGIGTGIGTHRDGYRDASGRIGTRDGNGTHRDACGTPPNPTFPGLCDASGRIGTHRDASPSSPLTLPSSPEIPEKEEEDARGTGENGTPNGTHRDAQDRDASGRIGTHPSPPPTPTRENPLEVLARASKGRVSTLASTHDQIALALQLTTLGLAGAELEAFGAALAGDGLRALWPKSEAVARLRPHQGVNAGFFLGRDGTARMLVDGVQRWREAQAEAAARKAPAPRPAAAPPRLPALPPDPAAAGARARALLGRPAPALAERGL